MTKIQRRSPVQFNAGITQSEVRDNWTVVLSYGDEGRGPFVVDLCHNVRWDLQDKHLSQRKPLGQEIPAVPGACRLQDGMLINRMNRTQAAIWHLLPGAPAMPAESGYTDVTDATICLALFGSKALALAEKLSALDFRDPQKQVPFLMQGPFSHVPCQLVALEKGRGLDGGLLLTCSRGYALSMVHAILAAGAEFGLRPAGEQRFTDWLVQLSAGKAAA